MANVRINQMYFNPDDPNSLQEGEIENGRVIGVFPQRIAFTVAGPPAVLLPCDVAVNLEYARYPISAITTMATTRITAFFFDCVAKIIKPPLINFKSCALAQLYNQLFRFFINS